jgi:hypothetical protein
MSDDKSSDAEAPYEMANLTPRTTGLPMVVWVSGRGRARHGALARSPCFALQHGVSGGAAILC